MYSKTIFLDRDGVINQELLIDGMIRSPRTVRELKFLNGSVEAIQELQRRNFTLVVVTNQPDISRGLLSIENLTEIHNKIRKFTGIEYFYFCPHDNQDKCICRKPKTGLFEHAQYELNLNLEGSYLIGDRWSDIVAGQKMSCICYFVENGYDKVKPPQPYRSVISLLEATKMILSGDVHV